MALVVHHLVHLRGHNSGYSSAQVRRLARKIAPATLDELALVMTADSNGRPPLESPETMVLIARMRARARELALEHAAPRPLLQGRHLVALGRKPGREFKPFLDAAFEAQLDGAFTDEAGAIEWLAAHPPK